MRFFIFIPLSELSAAQFCLMTSKCKCIPCWAQNVSQVYMAHNVTMQNVVSQKWESLHLPLSELSAVWFCPITSKCRCILRWAQNCQLVYMAHYVTMQNVISQKWDSLYLPLLELSVARLCPTTSKCRCILCWAQNCQLVYMAHNVIMQNAISQKWGQLGSIRWHPNVSLGEPRMYMAHDVTMQNVINQKMGLFSFTSFKIIWFQRSMVMGDGGGSWLRKPCYFQAVWRESFLTSVLSGIVKRSFADLTTAVEVDAHVKQHTKDFDMISHCRQMGWLSPFLVLSN